MYPHLLNTQIGQVDLLIDLGHLNQICFLSVSVIDASQSFSVLGKIKIKFDHDLKKNYNKDPHKAPYSHCRPAITIRIQTY